MPSIEIANHGFSISGGPTGPGSTPVSASDFSRRAARAALNSCTVCWPSSVAIRSASNASRQHPKRSTKPPSDAGRAAPQTARRVGANGLAEWLTDRSLRCREEIFDGIDSHPEALQFMFHGGNIGKLLVKIA